jgi:hypothetical protein
MFGVSIAVWKKLCVSVDSHVSAGSVAQGSGSENLEAGIPDGGAGSRLRFVLPEPHWSTQHHRTHAEAMTWVRLAGLEHGPGLGSQVQG